MFDSRVHVMGILNVTPDSFSDGGEYFDNVEKAVERAKELIEEGADSIDIGGESTRPGSESISVDEELRRVIPVVAAIHDALPQTPLSIDTYKSQVAEKALQKGASFINSMGGFMFDKSLADVIKKYECQIIIYHIKGTPKTMQKDDIHYDNIIEEIVSFFRYQMDIGISKGIKEEKFILDPGIGFGKTIEQNIEIIKYCKELRLKNLPLLIGISRKSTLGAILKEKLGKEFVPKERLEAGLAATAIAYLNGARIFRTHDVLETKKFLAVLDAIN